MLETLRLALIEALRAQGVGEPVVTFDYPELVHGDLTTNVALVYAKTLGIPPRALAESLVQALPPTETISSVSVAGPGFINITFISWNNMYMKMKNCLPS
jgi:arginyl-tRNA synthetase